MFAKFAMVALLIAYGTTDDDGMWCMLAKLFITRNNLTGENTFLIFPYSCIYHWSTHMSTQNTPKFVWKLDSRNSKYIEILKIFDKFFLN